MSDATDPKTLMSLLKEKAVEMKNLKKRLKKCEEKYVENFKTNKLLVIDRDNLIKLLLDTVHDPNSKEKLKIDEYGCYDYEILKPIIDSENARHAVVDQEE